MCLAVPLKLSHIAPDHAAGTVEVNGSPLNIGLDLVPEADIGRYVLVHAGMAIELLEDEDAHAILDSYEKYVHTGDQFTPGETIPDAG